MAPLPCIAHPLPAISGASGSCYVKGNRLPLLRRTSGVSLFARYDPLKLGTRKGQCIMKRSINCEILCTQQTGSCCNYLNTANIFHKSYIGRQLYFHNRSLRHIVPRSDVLRSGTPDAASPLSEVKLGSKIRGAFFYAVAATLAIFLFVLMLVAHPFVLLFDRYQRKAQHLIAKIWATLTITPFYKVEFEGLEHLPGPDTPAVYVSNHQSFLDIYTLLTLGRCFKFISKTSIFLLPVIGWAMFLMGVIPLKRMDSRSQLDCLKRCMDLIKGGASVFFFPEGTRSKDGKLGAFKKGAFSVAAKTGVPVVPMTIMGTGNIMPAGREGLLHPGSVKVVVHPILIGNDAQELCNQARTVIADSLGQEG